MADITALLDALNVFSSAPDKTSIAKANAWLQDFQHSVNPFRHGHTITTLTSDAWTIALVLLVGSLDNMQHHSVVTRDAHGGQSLRGTDFSNQGECDPAGFNAST